MRKFDTKVQLLKYKVLREVARIAFDEGEFSLANNFNDIAKTVTSDKATMRCCIYKERAIVAERIKLACGGNRANPNIIEVIDIACDECPASGYQVSHDCRGCIAHRCESACRKGAISFDENQKAHIDKTKCVNCGQCAKVCPYSAISNYTRPCEKACKIKAISMADSEENPAQIDNNKCINCGACSYACPFGAIMDKSFILDAIRMLKDSNGGENYNVYAVVAPSIASQFVYAKLGQVVTAIKKLGFYSVVEAALGADIVAYSESKELAEKGFLTSSCCPAFVDYVKKFYPKLTENISHNLSPMAAIAKYIKETDETAKVIFIGPCTAKKAEAKQERVAQYVDCVLTFEELQALIDSRDIELTELPEDVLDNAGHGNQKRILLAAHVEGIVGHINGCLQHDIDEQIDGKPAQNHPGGGHLGTVEKQGEDHGAADLCQNEGEKVDTVGTDDVAQHVRDRGADGSHDGAEDHCA